MSYFKSFLSLMAIGDAFGMKYEFVKRSRKIDSTDLSYGRHPSFKEYKKARYTDDTQMSLANTELLLAFRENLSDITEDDFIAAWLKTFKRDPRRGYSEYMYRVMSDATDPAGFKSRIDPERGTTGGAAMRSAPFGLLQSVKDVKRLADMQARITHDTQAGRLSAQAVALTVHFLHNGGRRVDIPVYLNHHLGVGWNGRHNGYEDTPNNGLKIVTQALNALMNVDSLSGLLVSAVNQESPSDTDTVCALAMVMASRCLDLENDLPPALTKKIEKGAYGLSYLQDTDKKITAAFPSYEEPPHRVKSFQKKP